MKTNALYLGIILPVAAAVAACAEFEPTPTELANEEYTVEFAKTFGLIGKNQDWNIAERKGVTVITNSPQQVKVYAKINGTFYLVADYQDVSGKRYLEFDVPELTEKLKVVSGAERREAVVGGTVDLTRKASRAGSSGGIVVTELTDPTPQNMASWLRMKGEGVMRFNNVIPENEDNRDKITHNFLYESTGPFIIHPVYWHTSQSNTLGIYYFSDDPDAEEITNYATNTKVKIKRIPIYKINDGNQQVFLYNSPTSDNTDENGYIYKNASGWNPVPYCGQVDAIFSWGGYSEAQFMSRGVEVNVPIGMRFGMYIELSSPSDFNGRSGKYFYSQSDFNPDVYYERKYREGQPHTKANLVSSTPKSYQACHAGTFIGSDRGGIALTFEDWNDCNNDSDMDMNDMVFVLFGAGLNAVNPEIVAFTDEPLEDTPYQWIISAEDLGAIGDFDFNDVVFGVEHVAGQTTARLTALAAGGTMPVKLLYNGEVVRSSDGMEQFHHWFVGNPPTTTMINTYNPNAYKPKPATEITVPADFTIATMDVNHNVSPNYSGGKMGGFSLEVERPDGTYTYIEAPGTGQAPQMICMPAGWAWPVERANISDAYKQFALWVASPEDYAEWYKTHYNTTLLTGVPHYVDPTENGGGNTGGEGTGGGSTMVSLTCTNVGTLWGAQLYKFTCESGFKAGMTLQLSMNITNPDYAYMDTYFTSDSNTIGSGTTQYQFRNGTTYTLTEANIAAMTGSDGSVAFYGLTWNGNTLDTLTAPNSPGNQVQ